MKIVGNSIIKINMNPKKSLSNRTNTFNTKKIYLTEISKHKIIKMSIIMTKTQMMKTPFRNLTNYKNNLKHRKNRKKQRLFLDFKQNF